MCVCDTWPGAPDISVVVVDRYGRMLDVISHIARRKDQICRMVVPQDYNTEMTCRDIESG